MKVIIVLVFVILLINCTNGNQSDHRESIGIVANVVAGKTQQDRQVASVGSIHDFNGYWFVTLPSDPRKFQWIIKIETLTASESSWREAEYRMGQAEPSVHTYRAFLKKGRNGGLALESTRKGVKFLINNGHTGTQDTKNELTLNLIIPGAEMPPFFPLLKASPDQISEFSKILGTD